MKSQNFRAGKDLRLFVTWPPSHFKTTAWKTLFSGTFLLLNPMLFKRNNISLPDAFMGLLVKGLFGGVLLCPWSLGEFLAFWKTLVKKNYFLQVRTLGRKKEGKETNLCCEPNGCQVTHLYHLCWYLSRELLSPLYKWRNWDPRSLQVTCSMS